MDANLLRTALVSVVTLAAASAHAETHNFTVGGSIGPVAQESGFLLLQEKATLMETQVHAGYNPGGWVETGVSLGFGAGDGLRSMTALADLRIHVFPMLPVNPTLLVGAGAISEHGTDMGDASSNARFTVVAGPGLEGHLGRWTASLDFRLQVVSPDGTDPNVLMLSKHDTFAHEAIFAGSIRGGVSYAF